MLYAIVFEDVEQKLGWDKGHQDSDWLLWLLIYLITYNNKQNIYTIGNALFDLQM